jgi:hypothetical protein
MIFIYWPVAISLNSYENEKLSTLATKMGEGLAIFPTLLVLASSSASLRPSKELVVSISLLGWYLFIFDWLQGVDISGLFRLFFSPLTSFFETSRFIFYVLCVICFAVPVSLAPFTRPRSIDSPSESDHFMV